MEEEGEGLEVWCFKVDAFELHGYKPVDAAEHRVFVATNRDRLEFS